MEREAGRLAEWAIYHGLKMVRESMTDMDELTEIIVAKHNHGVRPSEIARQLEIPVRRVTQVTGRISVDSVVSPDRIMRIVGDSEFTASRIASELCVELPTVRRCLFTMEGRGIVARVGHVKVGRQMAAVWRAA